MNLGAGRLPFARWTPRSPRRAPRSGRGIRRGYRLHAVVLQPCGKHLGIQSHQRANERALIAHHGSPATRADAHAGDPPKSRCHISPPAVTMFCSALVTQTGRPRPRGQGRPCAANRLGERLGSGLVIVLVPGRRDRLDEQFAVVVGGHTAARVGAAYGTDLDHPRGVDAGRGGGSRQSIAFEHGDADAAEKCPDVRLQGGAPPETAFFSWPP